MLLVFELPKIYKTSTEKWPEMVSFEYTFGYL